MSGRQAYVLLAEPRGEGSPFNYPHQAVALAEGLREIGWDVAANAAAWREGPGGAELFRPEPEAWAASADLTVVDRGWPDQTKRPLPAWLFDANRRFRTAGLDYGDIRPAPSWCYDSQLRGLDLVLRSHYCDAFRYPANVRPWAFGPSRRILGAARRTTQAMGSKARRVAWNFQHKEHPHDVRLWCERHLLPKLRDVVEVDETIHRAEGAADSYEAFMWRQTCGRHSGAYFRGIAGSMAVAAFGGWFTVRASQVEGGRVFRAFRKSLRKLRWRGNAVAQWDSWRFWEAMCCGSVPLQMDFGRFGMRLPVGPEHGRHYLGLGTPAVMAATLDALRDADRLAEIGAAGRAWAIEHYAPAPTARRLLGMLDLA